MALTQEEKDYVKRLRAAGADDENVLFYLEKRRKDEASMPKEEKSVVEKIWEPIIAFWQWLTTWTIKWAGNIVGWGLQLISKKWTPVSDFGEAIQSGTQKAAWFLEEKSGLDKWMATWLGEFSSNLIGGTMAVKWLSKWLWLAGNVLSKQKQYGSIAPYVEKVGNFIQGSSLKSKVAKWALTWAKETAWFQAFSEGKVTKEFVWTWAVIWGALPIAWAVATKGKEFLTKKIPSSLQLQGLMNPAKVTMARDQIIQEWFKAPDDVAQWMINRWIRWDKQTIIKTLLSRADDSKQAVDDSLALIQTKVSSDVAKKWLQQTYDDISKLAWREDDAAEILGLLKKKKYTLSELNQAKRLLDKEYNLYTKAWLETSGSKIEGIRNIRQQIRKQIEVEAKKAWVKNIALLNNETQVSRTLADAISKKESADAVRELLTAFAPSGVGGIIGSVAWPFDWSTVEGRVWNILTGIIAGKTLWSTKVKTNVAALLSKLNTKQVNALDEFIKSGGKTKLADDILNKMDEFLDIPTLQEVTTEKQTVQQVGKYITLPKWVWKQSLWKTLTPSIIRQGGTEVLQWWEQ